jgi:hypothetical protein
MTAIEILNLDYYLDNNPKLKKFKDLTLLEEIKNNYILTLRKEENQNSLVEEKFMYFIRQDRDYIISELNEIVNIYYFYFLNFIISRDWYVEELEKIDSSNINEIKNFLSDKLSIYIGNYLDYTEGKNYGNKCYTSVDISFYEKEYNFKGIWVGREYVSGGIKDFLHRLLELSEKFPEGFVFTNSAKKLCKKILLQNKEDWSSYNIEIKNLLELSNSFSYNKNTVYLSSTEIQNLNILIDRYFTEEKINEQ